MKIKTMSFSATFVLLAILLTACNRQITIEPSATIPPRPTETPAPLPTSTPTITATVAPTDTAIPQGTSLSGTISLSGDSAKPFVSSVELRQGESFTLVASSNTDSGGVYKIENIDPGTYGLWILITSTSEMISGCKDVVPPDDQWKIGIVFGGDKALTMENASLGKVLLLAGNLQSSDLKAEGFFAVLDGFEIASGIENKMDVTLICK